MSFAYCKTRRSSSTMPCKTTGFQIRPFIPAFMHLSHIFSSALAVRAIITGPFRLCSFRILLATSKPSISGMWRSTKMIRKAFTEGAAALRHSKPEETAETSQPSFSSTLLVTFRFILSSSATRTLKPLKRGVGFRFGSVCSDTDGVSSSVKGGVMNLWWWNCRRRVILWGKPKGAKEIQISPCIICENKINLVSQIKTNHQNLLQLIRSNDEWMSHPRPRSETEVESHSHRRIIKVGNS